LYRCKFAYCCIIGQINDDDDDGGDDDKQTEKCLAATKNSMEQSAATVGLQVVQKYECCFDDVILLCATTENEVSGIKAYKIPVSGRAVNGGNGDFAW